MRVFINPTKQPSFILVGSKVINIGLAMRDAYLKANVSNMPKDQMERHLLTEYGLNVSVVEASWHWTTVTIDVLPPSPFEQVPELSGALVQRGITPTNRQYETQKYTTNVIPDPSATGMDTSKFAVFTCASDIVSEMVLYYHSEISESGPGAFEGHFVLKGDNDTDGDNYTLNQTEAKFVDHNYGLIKVYYHECIPKAMVATLRRLTARAYAEWDHIDSNELVQIARDVDYDPHSEHLRKTVSSGTGVFIGEPLRDHNGAVIGAPGVYKLRIPAEYTWILNGLFATSDGEGHNRYTAVMRTVGNTTYTRTEHKADGDTMLASTDDVIKWALETHYECIRAVWDTTVTVSEQYMVQLFPWRSKFILKGECMKNSLREYKGIVFDQDETAMILGMSKSEVYRLAEDYPAEAKVAVRETFTELANQLDRLGMDMATGRWPDPTSTAAPAPTEVATKAGEMPDGDDPWF